jgi:hypothetical protein
MSISRSVGAAARWVLAVCCVIGLNTAVAQTGGTPPARDLLEGEELVYNVSYAFLDLGQIRIKTVSRVESDGRTCYFCQAFIDSYKKVPFVDLHAVFESLIDTDMYSRRFMGKVKQDAVWDFNRYRFEYDRKRVLIDIGNQDTVVSKRDTAVVESPYQDGLSLFYFARRHLYDGKTLNVPTLVKEKKVNTVINFKNRRTTVDIDAVDYPVDVIEFDGTMDFVGIFGLTGDFEGWFSNDEARIPIYAKMKVIVGSVSVELMEWKRPGWSPPKGE